MRVYISGIQSTVEIEKIKEFLPNNTLIYYPGDNNRKRIELIMSCDALFLTNEWQKSWLASREKSIAELLGLKIIYQSQQDADTAKIEKVEYIKTAIEEVCRLKFDEYAVESKNRDKYFARMIFVRQCKNIGISYQDIAELLNKKSHFNLINCNKKYDDDYQYNNEFRSIAQNVEKVLMMNTENTNVSA